MEWLGDQGMMNTLLEIAFETNMGPMFDIAWVPASVSVTVPYLLH